MPERTTRRRKYLLKPRLQIGAALVLLATASLYVLLQAILFQVGLARIEDPATRNELTAELLPFLKLCLLGTAVILVPLTMIVGIYMTHKVVGPLYRFEVYLQSVVRGERPGPCKLRKGDELQDLCELINEAVRAASAPATGATPAGDPPIRTAA